VNCGAALMWAGIALLGFVVLPATCWLFATAIAMILIGHTLAKRFRWR
jgi:heme O synthase-like polyprenyltransferase